jgi:hypothetical protein
MMDEPTQTTDQPGYGDPQGTGPEDILQTPHDAATQGYAPETVNLVYKLLEEDQKKCAESVCTKYDRDYKSSEKYRTRRANIIKLFLGLLDQTDNEDGESRSAQVHYPIIATAIMRMHARIYDQQFPSNGEFFGVKPTDANDLERTVRVAKHLNWQINHQIPEYVMNHDVLIQQWLLYGSAFSFMYWDPVKNRPCHEVCRTEDIVLPYHRSSTDPTLADVPRITRVLRMYRHELMEMEATGYYSGVTAMYAKLDSGEQSGQVSQPQSQDDKAKSNPVQAVIDRAQGVDPPSDGDDGPRKLIEQHCWYKLPGDDKERPVIITVDYDTKTLLCLKLREDEDPEDRARYNREKAANQASYQAALAQYQMDMAAYLAGQTQAPTPGPMGMTPPPAPGAPDMTAPPNPGPMTATVPPAPGPTDATMPMAPPPTPPTPPPDPAAVKMVPINFFTHYVCIPNPEGIYGFGIGYMLEGHNMVADVVASQVVDAGTLANTATGIRSRQTKLRGGEFRIKPGEIVEVDLAPEQLDKGIKILEFPPPNPQLAQFIKDQKEEAQELSGANEILSGEVGGSNETATTTQIRISQALAAISILNKRYTRARTFEGKALARLNSVHLDDDTYFSVVDPFKGQVVQGNVARMDYLEDVDITVTADPRMASQPQRFQEAQTALNVIMSNPLTANNPVLVHAAMKNMFIAMDRPDLVAALDAPPPMPPPGAPPPGGPPGPPPKAAKPGGPPPGQAPNPPPRVPNAGPNPSNGPFAGQGQ